MGDTVDTLAGEKVFLRRASGLIKSASTVDVAIFNCGLVSVGIGIANMVLYQAYIYPGASIGWASLIAGLCMISVGLGMMSWTTTIPRSGGIYVFGTRSLWPPLAFTLSFVECFTWNFYGSLACIWLFTVGILPGIATVGVVHDLPGWIATAGAAAANHWAFLGGVFFACISGWLLITGMRNFFIVQKIVFTIAVVGTTICFFVLIFAKHATFVANFNEVMAQYFPGVADPYNHIIQAAKGAGWGGVTKFDGWQTWIFCSWPFMPYIGSAFSIAIGGEVRSGGKGQLIGFLFAILYSIAAFIIIGEQCTAIFGEEFLGAASYAYYEGIEGAILPAEPWFTLYFGVLFRNVPLTFFLILSMMSWIWLWVPTQQVFPQRGMIAWAFDRVAPDFFGYVSPRTHTPVYAILITVATNILFAALYLFTDYFSTVIWILSAMFAWWIVLWAGIFFPYRKPEMYAKSPIAGIKVLGLPLQTAACGLAVIGGFLPLHFMWSDPFSAGHDPHSLIVMASLYVIGFIWFFVFKYYRKSQGIDVNLAYKEIPIE